MRYHPTDLPDRSYVSAQWNRYYLRSMQIILQATHGVVSGSPQFFCRAFGESKEEFEELLLRPQHFLFNRFWYEEFDGRAEFDEYKSNFKKLSKDERKELVNLLSSTTPSGFSGLIGKTISKNINRILSYYVPLNKNEEAKIWKIQRQRLEENKPSQLFDKKIIPEDELVEDAGLAETI